MTRRRRVERTALFYRPAASCPASRSTIGEAERRLDAPRDVGHDGDSAVPRLVHEHAGMPINARDPFSIRRVGRVELDGHAAKVEREPRRDGFDELLDAIA